MTAGRRYFGDIERAARLYAAREGRGFRTTSEAAHRYGWPEARYRAHESAIRRIGEEDASAYCKAFGISREWLDKGPSYPSETDWERRLEPLWKERADRLRAAYRPDDILSVAIDAPARRVRIARRLAGYRNATEAARAMGIVHTTLSAVERGVHGLTDRSAHIFASHFGCEPRWLLEGSKPTGYSPEIDDRIPSLLVDYDLPERAARERLPTTAASRPKRRSAILPSKPSTQRGKNATGYDQIPQYEAASLAHCGSDLSNLDSTSPTLFWPVPAGYLRSILRANARYTIVVAIGNPIGGLFSAGDRLFVDTSQRLPTAELYLGLRGKDEYIVLDGDKRHHRDQLREPPPDLIVVGRIVGTLGRPQHPSH